MKPLEAMGIKKARKMLIKKARGDVLEIGAGTGANLSYYDMNQIQSLTVTDQSRSKHLDVSVVDKVSFTEASAEALPFLNDSFDTVVHTLVFCSVSDVDTGLAEIKRVLKPNGTLIFIEHVLPEKTGMKRLFRFLNPMWRKVAGGCNLTRDFSLSLEQSAFEIVHQGRFLNTVFSFGIATLKKDENNDIL
jgi:ubiquinone/menaquinone biosynthesis C-methylase UbiE